MILDKLKPPRHKRTTICLFNFILKKEAQVEFKKEVMIRGGSRIFSRGVFPKKFQKFCRLFFRSTKLIFRAIPENYNNLILTKKFAPYAQAKFLKKQVKYTVFGHFLEKYQRGTLLLVRRSNP